MAVVSVNTNYGAALALQNLNATQQELSQTQTRISTGLKVSSAKDNGAIFAIAQTQRAAVAGLDAVTQSLQRGQSVVDVASAAGQQISDLLNQLKAKALAAADSSISSANRTALQNDFNALRDQITKISNTATFDGVNLIKTGATNLTSIANIDLSKITVQAQVLSLHGIGLSTTTTFTSATTASSTAALVDTAIANVSSALASLGTGSSALQRQTTFVGKLQDSLNAGIGALVDADLARESANLQALQTKQQLGVQALSIANQTPQVILGLFK